MSSFSRARTGLIVLVGLLTELIIIAAADNQWVSEKIVRNELRTNNVTLRSLANSWLTYTWRLSPRDGANANQLWASQLALLLTLLVVTGLLVAAVVRGPITFWRAFFGTWMAVIVATLLGSFVRGLIEPYGKLAMANSNRVTRSAFGSFGVNQAAVAAGFGLGLVVAAVAATTAVISRRSGPVAEGPGDEQAEHPPYQQPEQPPPFYGNDEAATTQLPSLRPDDSPPAGAPAGVRASEPAAAGPPAPTGTPEGATARYQPIDDDDDLGHRPEQH